VSLELVVDVRVHGIWLALLKDGQLTELHEEKRNTEFAVGDVYLGKVRRIVPSLNAAFVDIGHARDAFLHYLDLGIQFRSEHKFTQLTLQKKQNVADLLYFEKQNDIDKNGKISDVLSVGESVLVQVAKESISTKGPRLNAELTIAGRYLVLYPFSSKISVSHKIRDNKEKKRLLSLVKAICPKNFGVIVRTVAEGKKVEQIDQDLKDLLERWAMMHDSLKSAKAPVRVLGEIDRTTSMLRDILSADFTNIHVNDELTLKTIRSYITTIAPERRNIVKLYKGKARIFEHFKINRQIKAAFGKKVPLPKGGHLIIEHTEAMHVIDVNSGNRKGTKVQEENALNTNILAATEIARILQLRDMGGIICIDFIDMHNKANNIALFEHLKTLMKTDRAKHNILPPSKFGVVEITRQRVRQETDIKTSETCPTCNGTGEIQASILLTEEIENYLEFLIIDKNEKKVTIVLHPYLEAYFKKGWISKQWKWLFKYKKWIPIRASSNFHLLQYVFFDKDNKQLKI